MTIPLPTNGTVLFTGDSITDCHRLETDVPRLGDGYVRDIAAELSVRLPGIRVLNTGISGNRVPDLEQRWDADCLALRPDVLTILIGINDTWRRYDSDDPTSVDVFEAGYRRLLTRVRDELGCTVALMEPFLTPISKDQDRWREDLDPKIDAVRRLAQQFETVLLPTDRVMNEAAERLGAAAVAYDGVHPTPLGHRALADTWLTQVSAVEPA
ncbi:SGNH/GDSL hydrolase family protein [Diaminobutyricibacter sp. McL0608]|uniref:SGNH/GDSL hydrolase family protein n=1 Tax=Leifsonia sp. McL0608 TaxID=3143537 RepID=UPI0031F2F12F